MLYRRFVPTALGLFFLIAAPALAAPSSGTDFWITFPYNGSGNPDQVELSLVIVTAAPAGAAVQITSAALGVNTAVNVTTAAATTVAIPFAAHLMATDTVEDLGIHVTSDNPVSLYPHAHITASSSSHLALPVAALGTSYIVAAWDEGLTFGQVVLLGTQDDTTVMINPAADSMSYPAGVPFFVTLDAGDTFRLSNPDDTADFTGTTITSDQPVAVYGGHACASIPVAGTEACDPVIEQMLPVASWGTSFLTVPLDRESPTDVIRILAAEDDTEVSINGVLVATLDARQMHEAALAAPAHVTATAPVFVAQYARGGSLHGAGNLGDPLMITILPTTAFDSSYVFSTETAGWADNMLNIVAPASATASVLLDGVAVPQASFSPIGSSGYSGVQLATSGGRHTVSAPAPVGVYVYGFDTYDGYGYPAGALAAVLESDLSITKSATTPVPFNGPITYTIVVTNEGPATIVGANVTDVFPPELSNVSWTCSGTAGTSCTSNGSGDINDLVTLPAGGSVTYTVIAQAPAYTTTVLNTAAVAMPDNATDPDVANNEAGVAVDVVLPAADVPTASTWALIVLGAVLALSAVKLLGRT